MTGTTGQLDKPWFTRRKALQAHLDELIMESVNPGGRGGEHVSGPSGTRWEGADGNGPK